MFFYVHKVIVVFIIRVFFVFRSTPPQKFQILCFIVTKNENQSNLKLWINLSFFFFALVSFPSDKHTSLFIYSFDNSISIHIQCMICEKLSFEEIIFETQTHTRQQRPTDRFISLSFFLFCFVIYVDDEQKRKKSFCFILKNL